MEAYDMYKDIAKRTNGDIYIGVVGPVRTGKSTFISKLSEQLIIPNIEDEYAKNRVIDELPQSAAGRSVMTTQPKFVPNRAIKIDLDENASFSLRLVDCVGYMVNGATGHMEGDVPRMVKTPWYENEIPFEEAAEIGTRKVIRDHSTVGVIMTTDGSFSEIPRSSYVPAEERVVSEMKEMGKPFVIVLNSAEPESEQAKNLAAQLKEKYRSPVLLMNILAFGKEEMLRLLSDLLYEFPIKEIDLKVSKWLCALDREHWLLSDVLERLAHATDDMQIMRDHEKLKEVFTGCDYVDQIMPAEISLGSGRLTVHIKLKDALFYQILGEECGEEVRDDSHLLSMMKEMVAAKREYDRLEAAIRSAKQGGYGIVPPQMSELMLEEPELTQQSGRFGVRLKASAPCLHIVKVDVEASVSPMIGDEKQSKELAQYLENRFESDPSTIWETDIFGKSLSDVVREGLNGKISGIPQDAQEKIRETLTRITNEGDGGMLCILL